MLVAERPSLATEGLADVGAVVGEAIAGPGVVASLPEGSLGC